MPRGRGPWPGGGGPKAAAAPPLGAAAAARTLLGLGRGASAAGPAGQAAGPALLTPPILPGAPGAKPEGRAAPRPGQPGKPKRSRTFFAGDEAALAVVRDPDAPEKRVAAALYSISIRTCGQDVAKRGTEWASSYEAMLRSAAEAGYEIRVGGVPRVAFSKNAWRIRHYREAVKMAKVGARGGLQLQIEMPAAHAGPGPGGALELAAADVAIDE